LKKTYPKCAFEMRDKQDLFVKIFEDEAYNNRKMNNLTASLSSILQDFLVLEHLKKGSAPRQELLSEIYRERKLDRLSIQQLSGLQKSFDTKRDATTQRYYKQFKLYHELYFHPETRRMLWQESEDYNFLKSALNNLKLFNAHTRLRYLCEIKFRGAKTPKEFALNPKELKAIEELIHQHDAPLLEIYWLLYHILRQPDDNVFKAVTWMRSEKCWIFINLESRMICISVNPDTCLAHTLLISRYWLPNWGKPSGWKNLYTPERND